MIYLLFIVVQSHIYVVKIALFTKSIFDPKHVVIWHICENYIFIFPGTLGFFLREWSTSCSACRSRRMWEALSAGSCRVDAVFIHFSKHTHRHSRTSVQRKSKTEFSERDWLQSKERKGKWLHKIKPFPLLKSDWNLKSVFKAEEWSQRLQAGGRTVYRALLLHRD